MVLEPLVIDSELCAKQTHICFFDAVLRTEAVEVIQDFFKPHTTPSKTMVKMKQISTAFSARVQGEKSPARSWPKWSKCLR